jgi:glycosyltransferase involved in cell wall biosynthesis
MVRKRTLFIVPSLKRAGAENQIVQLVNGLPTEYFDKHLLSYLPEDELLASVDAETVSYHPVRRQSKIDLQAAHEIGAIIDVHQIDVVHCTLENALLYGMLGARYSKRNPAFICAMHTTKQASFKHNLADVLLYKYLLKKCTQVWFMCQAQASVWIKRMPFLRERQKVIYNGVKAAKFDPGKFVDAGRRFREDLGISAGSRIICSIAGLRREKLHDVLLQSFGALRDSIEKFNCYLLLAGSGPMEGVLRESVRQLGIESQVMFLGELADVRPLLAAADCKVLASRAETFSMAMLEAMAMQVPVISTNVGGASEAIRDRESGLLITPGDAGELSDRLSMLLSDDAQRITMGRAARQTVMRSFTYTAMVEKSRDCLIEAD